MTGPFFASTREELSDRETLLSLSGLDFMRRVQDGRISGPPIGALLNYRVEEVAQGRVVIRGTPEFGHLNVLGGVHGGWYGTLLDSAMACAVMTLLPKGSAQTTLEFKVNLVRALSEGTEVLCIGTSQHAGRSTGVASGELRGADDGQLYASGSTTCLIMSS
ncbi:PaaI family thioesterase [Aliiruegeria haliotis]|uniref:PaaI family thioesterase n=1 Tax=Aliiruegeria haliotis TaxID=1280846 RepID=UPI001FE770D5|nr:PaaI family thioesterase [Aliiruegeria haliotis]